MFEVTRSDPKDLANEGRGYWPARRFGGVEQCLWWAEIDAPFWFGLTVSHMTRDADLVLYARLVHVEWGTLSAQLVDAQGVVHAEALYALP